MDGRWRRRLLVREEDTHGDVAAALFDGIPLGDISVLGPCVENRMYGLSDALLDGEGGLHAAPFQSDFIDALVMDDEWSRFLVDALCRIDERRDVSLHHVEDGDVALCVADADGEERDRGHRDALCDRAEAEDDGQGHHAVRRHGNAREVHCDAFCGQDRAVQYRIPRSDIFASCEVVEVDMKRRVHELRHGVVDHLLLFLAD